MARSSLCRVAQRSSRVVFTSRAILSNRKNIPGLEHVSNSKSLSTKTQIFQDANSSTSNEHSFLHSERHVREELVQALDNVIQVQKSLGLNPLPTSTNPQSFQSLASLDGDDRKVQVESWKKSLNTAISNHNIPLAIKLFYSPPALMNDYVDASLLNIYGSYADRLRPQNADAVIDAYYRFEELYANVHEMSDNELPDRIEMNRKLILKKVFKAISLAHPKTVTTKKFRHVINDLTYTIQSITELTFQHELYPALMAALLRSRMIKSYPFLQQAEQEVWDNALHSCKMMDEGFMSENNDAMKLYSDILKMSSYRKQEYLPFQYLLKLLVNKGFKPPPEAVLNVVQNEYPFFNVQSTVGILKSLIHLQKYKSESMADYMVDMGTLEHLCCVASRKGNSMAMQTLLNYIQEIQNAGNPHYIPTEGIYESMAQAFASSKRKEDHLVFAVLAEMESNGIRPSYIFLRGLSQAMRTRSSYGRLDAAFHTLRRGNADENEGFGGDEVAPRPTTSALNTIISGYADLGIMDRAYHTYTNFEEFGCEPNEDTFVFLMESVKMQLTTAIPPRQDFDFEIDEWILSKEDIADALVEEATIRGYHYNSLFVNFYVEILCATRNLDKAKSFLHEMISDAELSGEIPPIAEKTFSLLALNFAQRDDFKSYDEVRELCVSSGHKNGVSACVHEQIDRIREKKLLSR